MLNQAVDLNLKSQRIKKINLSVSIALLMLLIKPCTAADQMGVTTAKPSWQMASSVDDELHFGEQVSKQVRDEDRAVGEGELRDLYKHQTLVQDAWTQDELLRVYQNINAYADLGAPLALLVINNNVINAFAVPGGLIGINTGLILNAENEDQLAAVMAHEVSHIRQHHYRRGVTATKNQPIEVLGGVLAGLLLSRYNADIGSAVMIGSQDAAVGQTLAFSREYEREADRIGMKLLNQAGYNPRAMGDFFSIMDQQNRQVGWVPEYFYTHPLTQNRISEAYLRASQINPVATTLQEQRLKQTQFSVLKQRVAVLTGKLTVEDVESHRRQGQPLSRADGLALANLYANQRKFEKARALVDQVLLVNDADVLGLIVFSEVEIAAGQPKTAVAKLELALQHMPDQHALIDALAKAYIENHQSELAIKILKPYAVSHPADLLVWRRLLEAANNLPSSTVELQKRKLLAVLRYRAEVDFWSGHVQQAVTTLMRAQQVAEDFLTRSQVKLRLDAMADVPLADDDSK